MGRHRTSPRALLRRRRRITSQWLRSSCSHYAKVRMSRSQARSYAASAKVESITTRRSASPPNPNPNPNPTPKTSSSDESNSRFVATLDCRCHKAAASSRPPQDTPQTFGLVRVRQSHPMLGAPPRAATTLACVERTIAFSVVRPSGARALRRPSSRPADEFESFFQSRYEPCWRAAEVAPLHASRKLYRAQRGPQREPAQPAVLIARTSAAPVPSPSLPSPSASAVPMPGQVLSGAAAGRAADRSDDPGWVRHVFRPGQRRGVAGSGRAAARSSRGSLSSLRRSGLSRAGWGSPFAPTSLDSTGWAWGQTASR